MRSRLIFLISILFLVGCGARVVIVVTATPSPAPTLTLTPTDLPTETPLPPTDIPTITPTSDAIRLWAAPSVPDELQSGLAPLIKNGLYTEVNDESQAQMKLLGKGTLPGATWVYVPVVPFPTVTDDITWQDIQRYWKGDPTALTSLSVNNQPPIFIASASTIAWMTELLGTPDSSVKIQKFPAEGIVSALWLQRGNAWSIVPFHQLDPALKVLTVDGMSVFDRALDLNKYPLVQTIMLGGDSALLNDLAAALKTDNQWLANNRDQSKMTIMMMTGVTTMARAFAYKMETKGITYPAQNILPYLSDADFIHTSNETSFATDCPYPNPGYTSENLLFCSRDSYFDLLKTIKLNIVELTGNHVNDWGTDALNHTLDLYDANKIAYFGGGRNTEDARKALIVSHNGNTIALIGCNPVGPQMAWATDTLPGAAKCDDDFLSQEIPRLKTVANVVIMDIQYQEYYQSDAPPDQVEFFHKYAAMGADIILGTQAHQPQGFDFTGSTFIHYGLGNFFFDQMDDIPRRQMFLDKLIIYNRKHISTVLLSAILEDYAQPRPMTPDERTDFLKTLFKASGW